MKTESRQSRAFTLTELLVVIAIVGILVALRLPAFALTKQKSKQIACWNNCKQMGLASRMYSDNSPDGAYANEINSGSDDLNFLYPTYIRDRSVFVCPATQNYVRTNLYGVGPQLRDLRNNATHKGYIYGHSYEVKGWYAPLGGTVKKTYLTVNSYALTADNGFFNLRGTKPGPANTFIIMDGDDVSASVAGKTSPPAYNDFPDETDNHGRSGNHAAFCDGHAEFIKATQWLYRYVLSNDARPTVPPWFTPITP